MPPLHVELITKACACISFPAVLLIEGNYTYTHTAGKTSLRWTPIITPFEFDQIQLWHCHLQEECNEYDVKGLEEFTVEGLDTGTFQLVVVHAGKVIATSPKFVHVDSGGPDPGKI